MTLKGDILKNDVIKLLITLFEHYSKKYYCVRPGQLREKFFQMYPLKYQKKDKYIVNNSEILKIMRNLNVCSTFKFKGSNPKRFKIIKKKALAYKEIL